MIYSCRILWSRNIQDLPFTVMRLKYISITPRKKIGGNHWILNFHNRLSSTAFLSHKFVYFLIGCSCVCPSRMICGNIHAFITYAWHVTTLSVQPTTKITKTSAQIHYNKSKLQQKHNQEKEAWKRAQWITKRTNVEIPNMPEQSFRPYCTTLKRRYLHAKAKAVAEALIFMVNQSTMCQQLDCVQFTLHRQTDCEQSCPAKKTYSYTNVHIIHFARSSCPRSLHAKTINWSDVFVYVCKLVLIFCE